MMVFKKDWKWVLSVIVSMLFVFVFLLLSSIDSVKASAIEESDQAPIEESMEDISYDINVKYINTDFIEIAQPYTQTLIGRNVSFTPFIEEIVNYSYTGIYYENVTGEVGVGCGGSMDALLSNGNFTTDSDGRDASWANGVYNVYVVYTSVPPVEEESEAVAEPVAEEEPAPEKDIQDAKFHVTYHLNRGEGSAVVDDSEYSLNDVVTVSSVADLSRRNYVFDGWNTQLNGEGVDMPSNSTFVIIKDVTLYAKWIRVATLGTGEEGMLGTHENEEYLEETAEEDEEYAPLVDIANLPTSEPENKQDAKKHSSKRNNTSQNDTKDSDTDKDYKDLGNTSDDTDNNNHNDAGNIDNNTDPKSNDDNNSTAIDISEDRDIVVQKSSYASSDVQRVSSVKTGDNSQIIIYIFGAVAGIGIIVFLIITLNKKKKQDE